jgi:cytochrome b6-f complex iron-sulfur subunit
MLKARMPDTQHSRRAFCVHACQLVTLAGTASVLANCNSGPGSSVDIGTTLPVVTGSHANGVTTVTIDATSPLSNVGGMVFVQASSASFLVTRTSADACTALTTACTHQACTVSNASAGVFTCPCHGSQFDPAGRVVRGPATAPLQEFQSALVNNVLTING